MSTFRDEIGRVISKDPRYSLEAYAFVLESLHLARNRKIREARRQSRERAARTSRGRSSKKAKAEPTSGHVSGRQVCLAARRLALREYGLLAGPVLAQWGLRSTSDIGEIVYNLIASGDLDKTPEDRREDFDDVFDFGVDFQPKPLADDDPEEDESTEDDES
ncbi:Minf_1886 family protein [Paludisphaera rhizosphaerae]|uniref:Minf_1886 family protein n=1 Tax=Paludisphaera rhizosphaerae TaxID=2711216 RepID=UPI0013EB5467|nr:Minf_1886 family protein [Paludisphaera rhizosphaerae]